MSSILDVNETTTYLIRVHKRGYVVGSTCIGRELDNHIKYLHVQGYVLLSVVPFFGRKRRRSKGVS